MKAAATRASTATTISARRAGSLGAYVRECWDRRSLIGVLTGRELKASYEMNAVGFAWWLLEPLSLMLVYVILFQLILKTAEPAFPLFILLALLPFKWLSQSLTGAMSTMRANSTLVTDVYFPRALLPLADTLTGLAHFGVGLAIVPVFMIIYGIGPSRYLLFLPVVIAVQFLLTWGLAYPLAVWGVYYRNLPGLTANLLRLWFYVSPGLWALARVRSEEMRTLVRLNPLTGIFEGYRGAFGLVSSGDGHLLYKAPGWDLGVAAALGVLALVIGGRYFVNREAQFGKLL